MPPARKIAMDGNHGKICAAQAMDIPIGAKARNPVARQKVYDKKIRQFGGFLNVFLLLHAGV